MDQDNLQYTPDIWEGTFRFSTENTFDLSQCKSTKNLDDDTLYRILTHVSDLTKDIEEIDLSRFITMSGLKDPKSKAFYATIWKDAGMRAIIAKWYRSIKNIIQALDQSAGLNEEEKAACKKVFKEV